MTPRSGGQSGLSRPASRLRLPRPTARLRLTLFYSALILASGTGLLAITYALMGGGQGLALSSAHGLSVARPARHAILQPGSVSVQSHGLTPQQALLRAGVAIAILAVLSVVLGWIVAGRVLRPVRTINATARRISAGNLHERLTLAGPDDEFKELAATLNDLLGRLESSFESQRHFVANASHELRTPLTVERTLLQVALANPRATADTLRLACQRVLISSAQQERLIEALLTLASSEQGLDRREPFDLAAITERAVASVRQQAKDQGVRIHPAFAAAPASGDPDLVECLVTNLVSNAVRYNVPEGWVSIVVGAKAGAALITVSNPGQAVAAEDVERLFQPFQRLVSQRTGHPGGHGLGLAIVRAVAAAHEAVLRVHARPAGGLDVEVCFPPPERAPTAAGASHASAGAVILG